MRLDFEVLLNDPDAGFILRAGNWVLTTIQGESTWSWEPLAPSEDNKPKHCIFHPRACWYDGLTCPACQAEKEFLALTKEMR